MLDALNDTPDLKRVHDVLVARFGKALLESTFVKAELSVRIRRDALLPVLRYLKSEQGFNALLDIIGLDRLKAPVEGRARFSLLYQLYRFPGALRIRIVLDTDEAGPVDSAVPAYKSADWAEREIFDMFGIRFAGHPDLRRIYLEEDFDGHPLRKDFPLEGKAPCRLKT